MSDSEEDEESSDEQPFGSKQTSEAAQVEVVIPKTVTIL